MKCNNPKAWWASVDQGRGDRVILRHVVSIQGYGDVTCEDCNGTGEVTFKFVQSTTRCWHRFVDTGRTDGRAETQCGRLVKAKKYAEELVPWKVSRQPWCGECQMPR